MAHIIKFPTKTQPSSSAPPPEPKPAKPEESAKPPPVRVPELEGLDLMSIARCAETSCARHTVCGRYRDPAKFAALAWIKPPFTGYRCAFFERNPMPDAKQEGA